jgi:N-succinyldiaminopimelate aminotransferase
MTTLNNLQQSVHEFRVLVDDLIAAGDSDPAISPRYRESNKWLENINTGLRKIQPALVRVGEATDDEIREHTNTLERMKTGITHLLQDDPPEFNLRLVEQTRQILAEIGNRLNQMVRVMRSHDDYDVIDVTPVEAALPSGVVTAHATRVEPSASPPARKATIARRGARYGTNIFTEINDLARKYNAINLGQGMPDFDGPVEAVQAFVKALESGKHNQYAPVRGTVALHEAVARHANESYGLPVEPAGGVIISPGATNALFVSTTGLMDPGDEVIIIEPHFDTYAPNVLFTGGVPVYVPLHPPNWTFDEAELRAAFNEKTRLIIINTPQNPTGRVFTLEELTLIADLCKEFNVTVISDEVYEKLLFDGAKHIPIATLPDMFERTVTIGSAGKVFGMTGWKVGWTYGPPELIQGVMAAHQFVTFAVNHPAQIAVAQAFTMNDIYADYYALYAPKREVLLQGLAAAGLKPYAPEGAYFITADFSDVFEGTDVEFARHLIREVGVACIPPTTFFSEEHRHIGSKQARFSFCKGDDTLQLVAKKLARLPRG